MQLWKPVTIQVQEEVQAVGAQESTMDDKDSNVEMVDGKEQDICSLPSHSVIPLPQHGDEASSLMHKVIHDPCEELESTVDSALTVETKLCKAIVKCTGETEEVKEFYRLIKFLKGKQNSNEHHMNVQKYKDLQKKIKITVVKLQRLYNKELADCENSSISKKGMCLVRKINVMNGLHYKRKKIIPQTSTDMER